MLTILKKSKPLPKPHEIGLPEQFETWRPNQEEILDVLMRSPKRADAICAPTGFGKTLVIVAFALMSGRCTCIVTKTKALQQQYLDEFEEIGMVALYGRSHYPCNLRPDYTCEDGKAASCPYSGGIGCPASQAHIKASLSRLVVTNYAKWTSSKKFGTGMSHFEQVIFDEGHRAFDALSEAMQVVLHHREIEEVLQTDFLKNPEAKDMAHWRMWAHGVKALAELAEATALAKISGVSNPKPSWVRQYNHMKNLNKSLGILSCARPADWVVEEIEKGFQFDPIRPAKYSEGVLLMHMPRVVVASATCRKKSMYLIGMGDDAFNFHEYLSDFRPEDCPIYYIPTIRVDVYAKSLSELWVKFDQIAARRRDRNGLVQSVSFKRSQELYEASRFRDSFIMNKRGEPIDSTIAQFLDSYPGAIMVGPSFEEGYNFPGTALEWIFCMKIPFDPPSAIAKARSEADPNYGGYQAMQRLVQLFGRGARYRGDRCEGFICDKHMDWFEPRFRGQAPKWFRQFFKREHYVPQPPPRLT